VTASFFGYAISITVGFQCQSDLFCYEISKTVCFVPLFFYEISKTVGFVWLRDFNDGQFCLVTRSQ